MKRILLAAALAATTAIAVPMIARSAEDAETKLGEITGKTKELLADAPVVTEDVHLLQIGGDE